MFDKIKGRCMVLTNQESIYINFETGKLPAHERNNFIFHVNMYFCNIVFTVIVSLMQILSIVDPAYHILQTFCNFVVK
jgi:hypothetical protein